MYAVEIEQATSDLALQPFDAAEVPFAFLAAFGHKGIALKRLRAMPENPRQAHEHIDDMQARIYIGRRFTNDTEWLEKLFDLYTKMTAANAKQGAKTALAKKAPNWAKA